MPASLRLRTTASRALSRWPAYAERSARIADLERSIRRVRAKIETVEAERDRLERAIGEHPSLRALEWVEHRAASTTGRVDSPVDADEAASLGLPVVDGPGDLEVLVFYGVAGALVEPRPDDRPLVMLRSEDGSLVATSAGPIDPLPAGLPPFLDAVGDLSVRRRRVHLRVEAARHGDSIAFVRIVPPEEPVRRFTRSVDRALGTMAEYARVRLRHDLAAPTGEWGRP